MSSATIDPLLGRLLAGKFEIRELLGVGAMGKVYRAHHEGLDKPVAIKVLMSFAAAEPAQAKRFRVEARAASRLEHPHSVRILDFGQEQDGLHYIVMEYLEGVDLQDVIAHEGPLDSRRVAWIMSQVFSALAAAHQRDVIHRDIKPGNVMLVEKVSEDGRIQDYVKVCDFGLAKILDPSAHATSGPLTAQGAVFGTPAYMSPEQAQGEPIDARCDLYSAGVVMYKMLTGHTPFRAEKPTGVLLGHIHQPPPPLASWGVAIDPAMTAIVERLIEKQREARFQTAIEARDALRAFLTEMGHETPPLSGAIPAPVRRETNVPTEQVRLRQDQAETEFAMPATELARPALPRADSLNSTMYADTMPPPAARAAPEPEAAPLQTLPPAASTADPLPAAPSQNWALIPAALALIGALTLVGVLLYRRMGPPPLRLQSIALEDPRHAAAWETAIVPGLASAQDCLQSAEIDLGAPVRVTARVGADARLTDVTVHGLTAAQECVGKAWSGSPGPTVDSAPVEVEFTLGYGSTRGR